MFVDLRDPKVIKLFVAVTTSVLAASIGFVALASGGRDISSPSANAIREGPNGSRMLIQGWDSNGWESNNDWSSVEVSSKTSKCVKSGRGGGESGGKAGKQRRRLGDSWGRVWTPPALDDKSNWQPSWSANTDGSWSDSDDCDEYADDSESDVLVFIKSGKAVKSKSSKSKLGKSKSSKTSLTATSNMNDWSSDWDPPSKTTDRVWSSPWTPPSEPLWGSSGKWTASPVPTKVWSSPWTPPSEPLWGSSEWTASPVPPKEIVPTPQMTRNPAPDQREVLTQNVS